ncbi:MAG: DNA polymerase III subunit delta [Clostridia bacterium]|nr:DNA polymerase III subunit delta [Clostridia bacterium]
MNHRELQQAIAAGKIGRLYLLDGTEENLKDEALQLLRKQVLQEGLEDLNEAVMDNPPTDQIIAAAETLPFIADRRLVIVRDLQCLTGRGETDDRLKDYMAHVPDTTVLVFFTRGKANGTKALYKQIKKHGQIVTFEKLKGAELTRWIVEEFRKNGKTCSNQVADRLSFTTGTDTGLLTAEIAKISSMADDRDNVDPEDIDRMATRSIECTVFEMVDAVVAGQQSRAFRLMRDMVTAGEDRLGILAMLLRQYRMLQHVKIMQYEKKSVQAMQQSLAVAPFVMERYLRQAKSYTGGQVKRAVDICLDTEYRVKSGRMNQEGSLEAAMLKIFALRQ